MRAVFEALCRSCSARLLDAQTRHAVAGDAVWVARARAGSPRAEYVLDAIVERKSVADLLGSVKGGRYEKQKYLLRRCGLRRLIYLIEGVPEAETAGVRSTVFGKSFMHGYRRLLTAICRCVSVN